MATMYEFQGHDRQETALLLFAKLGGSVAWHHQLMQWAKDGTGLHVVGPTLRPICAVQSRPVYDRVDIDRFVEEAREFDPTLAPAGSVRPVTYTINSDLLHPLIPYRARRARVTRRTCGTSALRRPRPAL